MCVPVLVWFKRDLRVHDHPALVRAVETAPVLPLYVIEPELWAQPDASARQWAFVAESLQSLQAALGALGQPLILRTGDAVDVLRKLHRRFRFTTMVSHEETGNGWTFARDRRVAAWARGAGVGWVELPQSAVIRRLPTRDGWGARRDAFMQAASLPPPVALSPLGLSPGAIPAARALGLTADRCAHRQQGGRQAAGDALESFLSSRGQNYRAAMSAPGPAERACSRLSPYLAHGVLSVREVVQATAGQRAARRGQGDWSASLRSFDKRLAWRDHFIQKLEDEPALEHCCLHRATESLRPRTPDPVRLEAWSRGETGLPFVDACMRYLQATGWLNFRMRAMLVSVASYHLWLDWRTSGQHLARLFTDYEPGIHWSQCQMQSGTTGINTIRIYNPVKQGLEQDPDGQFTRQWVPELAQVPDCYLHEPWKWPGAQDFLGRSYPEPVVDPVAAAKAAREAVHALHGVPGFRSEAARIARRHASRADRAGRFVNDRGARRPPRPVRATPDQLTLDL